MDELAVPNRSGNTTAPDTYLRDADDKEYGYSKPVVFINGYCVVLKFYNPRRCHAMPQKKKC